MWLLIFLSFFAGYLARTIITSYRVFMDMSEFVSRTADHCLVLMGDVVYRVALIDQHLYKTLHKTNPEEAKILKNNLAEDFATWKRQTVQAFLEEYPRPYQWQLEEKDWEGLMSRLTDIYKRGEESNE